MANKYKLGILDEEEAWVEKFKRTFKETFDVYIFNLTAETVPEDIVSQLEKEELDCVIADFELNETAIVRFNGEEAINAIRTKYPYFPVFIITGQNEDYVIGQVEDNDIVRDKAEIDDKTETLIQRILNKINSHYKQIEEAEETIKGLITKRNEGATLSIPEEEMLTEKYLFLEKISPSEKTLPDNFIQPESITRLNEFVTDTKLILEELKKLSK
jgi:DNA-binding NarL/FixJ family response regulator